MVRFTFNEDGKARIEVLQYNELLLNIQADIEIDTLKPYMDAAALEIQDGYLIFKYETLEIKILESIAAKYEWLMEIKQIHEAII